MRILSIIIILFFIAVIWSLYRNYKNSKEDETTEEDKPRPVIWKGGGQGTTYTPPEDIPTATN